MLSKAHNYIVYLVYTKKEDMPYLDISNLLQLALKKMTP
jgi:hypothetical protein